MKKTFVILTSLILVCIMFVGCQTTDATITTSKALNKNLNLLSNTVSRLDTIDNHYFVNDDIYTLNAINSIKPTPNRATTDIIANSNNVTILEEIDVNEVLTNEIINRLYCDENGNCKICKDPYTCNDNNMCGSCNQTIICDENGNCTTCTNPLYLDNDNACSSCKTNCISTTNNNKLSEQTKTFLRKISDNNQNLNVELLSTETPIDNENVNENKIDNTNEETATETTISEESSETIIENSDNHSNQNDILIDENSYNEIVNNDIINENNQNTDEEMNNYIEDEITDIQSNELLPNYKLFYYSETFNPSHYTPRFVNQIDYDSANSNFNNYVEKLQKLYSLTADVIEGNNTLSNYRLIVLENIKDAKDLNNCILTGNCKPTDSQLKALNNYVDDLRDTVYNLRNCNGDLTNQINKISTSNTGLTHSIDITNSNYLRILNQIDTRISYHENAISTLEQIRYLLEDANLNPQTEEIYVEDLNNNTIESDNENNNIIENNSADNNINENVMTNSNNTINDRNNTSIKNIDTYAENKLNNIDDNFKNNEEVVDNNTTHNNDILVNNDEVVRENNSINNNIVDDNTIVEDNNITDKNNTLADNNLVNNQASNNAPTMVDNRLDNNLNNNYDTNYNNSVITENNLNNTENGNNNYSYSTDGELFNNTNGLSGDEITNVNNHNNNVNTYKYNTLIDSINRGTVDNGINRL